MGDHLRAADVLASGIHDAKNRLFAIGTKENTDRSDWAEIQKSLLEVAFYLDRTLTAYRLLRYENMAAVVPVFIPHLVEDVLVRCQTQTRVQITTDIGFHGEWPLSRELVEETLINALQNAGRFARSLIRLSACERDGMLVFEVNDDGPGFDDKTSTGHSVGLYIAERIAQLHNYLSHDGTTRRGRLVLANGGELGGAQFLLELP
ncbi:MAG: ATP-binding protein [Georgfuchsia sp.]